MKRRKPRFHPVFDIEDWILRFPLSTFERADGPRHYSNPDPDEPIVDLWKARGADIDGPLDLVCMEQVRRTAAADHKLGPSVPVDVFAWSIQSCSRYADDKHPALTRLGGTPWRPASKKWPTGASGAPLAFIGQLSFADSTDLFDFELPGQVLLIFAKYDLGDLLDWDGLHLEWSPREIKKPLAGADCPLGCLLPFRLDGSIHRTANYPDAMQVFRGLGHDCPYYIHELQGTTIGTRASIPQGWPFDEGDGNTLIAVLNGVTPKARWPFLNRETLDLPFPEPFQLAIADGGCLFVYRTRKGKYEWRIEGM